MKKEISCRPDTITYFGKYQEIKQSKAAEKTTPKALKTGY